MRTKNLNGCSYKGCNRPARARELCASHVNQTYLGVSPHDLRVYMPIDTEAVVEGVYNGETIAEIGNRLGHAPGAISKAFKQATGIGVHEYKASKKAGAHE